MGLTLKSLEAIRRGSIRVFGEFRKRGDAACFSDLYEVSKRPTGFLSQSLAITFLYHLGVLQDIDVVIVKDLRDVMGDDDGGLSFSPSAYSVHDFDPAGLIQRTCGFI